MFKEFKEFIMRGNVMDMAVGIIIGAAFGKIVSSFVNDVLMPPIGKLLGGVDFTGLFITLGEGSFDTLKAAKEAGVATLNYGMFLQALIDFLIVAFAIFIMVKAVNKMKREPAPAPPSTKECPFCLTAIPIKATRCPACTSEVAAA
jgi:large conductance mechanosensitive channel